MTCRRLQTICCLLPILGCTPLGLWMYEDPKVTVDRVRLDVTSNAERPVVVALAVDNPNDYTVSATRFEVQLVLDDLPVGQLDREDRLSVPKAGVAKVAVPMDADRGATPARMEAFHTGIHRFMVVGRATFTTPVGKRKVRFTQQGELAFGPTPSPTSAPADPGASP
jgi:LEA14-like dessication related protein